MKWIKVTEDQKPASADRVLVYGRCRREIGDNDEYKNIGLVNWQSADYSPCADTDQYSVWYQDIEMFCHPPALPDTKQVECSHKEM